MTKEELTTLLEIIYDLSRELPPAVRFKLMHRLQHELPHMNWHMLEGSRREEDKTE